MSRKIFIFLVALSICAVAGAEEVQLRSDHPQTYTVQKGDTLWDISGRFLTHPWQWPEIWHINPQVADPHWIYPGDVLTLDYVDGKPRLQVVDRNVKLSPSIRESSHAEAIHAIPLDAIHQFLTRPRVVSESDLDNAAYIVGSQDDHLAFGSGFRVYARNLGEPATAKFSVFRKGGVYRDPDTNAVLGYEAEHVADALVEKFGDPATIQVVRSSKEVIKGDRLLAQTEEEYPEFIPHAPASAIDAKIISAMGGISQIAQHQVVVLNRGSKDGLEAGHVLAIFQRGAMVKDSIGSDVAYQRQEAERERLEHEGPSGPGRLWASVINDLRGVDRTLRDFVSTPIKGSNPVAVQLPEERAGELMVFRTFESVSYGLVMNIQRPVYVLDAVRNP
jgi:LysM domain